MGNAGGELHLKTSELLRTLSGQDHGGRAKTEDNEHTKADREIAAAKTVCRISQRAGLVFDQHAPVLKARRCNQRSTNAIAHFAATRPVRVGNVSVAIASFPPHRGSAPSLESAPGTP